MTADDLRLPGAFRTELARRAAADSLLDVSYDEVDSPFGPILVCATDQGIVRLALPAEDAGAVLQAVADRVSPRMLRAPGRIEGARAELGEYFEGRRRGFDLPLDWRMSAGFRLRALRAIARVPYGSTATYTEVAEGAGNARAVRAAGSACATNPLPIVVPCHRILRSGGGLGGYLGGLDMKRRLLAMEGAAA